MVATELHTDIKRLFLERMMLDQLGILEYVNLYFGFWGFVCLVRGVEINKFI